MEIVLGVLAGVFGFLFCYCLLGGLYTINQNERAVVTSFGRAERTERPPVWISRRPRLSARKKRSATFIHKFG
jgi:regulator of protease activity HflC (stomatin/prohibitin superfamily)